MGFNVEVQKVIQRDERVKTDFKDNYKSNPGH